MNAPALDTAIDDALFDYLPRERIKECYAKAPGGELREKFTSPHSSAALVANAFGLFLENPQLLSGVMGDEILGVELEQAARFPWAGGRHPCLDVLLTGAETLIGIESKRYEPFRGHPRAEFSSAYDRPVWGDAMEGYEGLRDQLLDDP